ncbi:hypothetical protein QYM36_013708 [Artemia franciscana]|uniref:Uncharacterized protein n=1 Tax=Artemia franciscana TaxID=6661 RepID=A0AA88HN67_ARTSF|nr:hypothetical protein QYM36_013708 [Artemia franciscana]
MWPIWEGPSVFGDIFMLKERTTDQQITSHSAADKLSSISVCGAKSVVAHHFRAVGSVVTNRSLCAMVAGDTGDIVEYD